MSEAAHVASTVGYYVAIRVRASYCGARLFVAPGAVVVSLTPWSRRITGVEHVVHTRPDLLLIEARLLPPWMNTGLVLHGDEGATVITPMWLRRPIRTALEEFGFTVRVQRTWVSTGYVGA